MVGREEIKSSHHALRVVQIYLMISVGHKSSHSMARFSVQVSVGLKSWELPRWNLKLVPVYGGSGKTKEADHPRLVGGNFKKQENLYTRLVSGGGKSSRSQLLLPIPKC